MGSPLSPVIANLVLERLKKIALASFNRDLSFYYRMTYVWLFHLRKLIRF